MHGKTHMTCEEIKKQYPGKRLVAMADKTNGLTLYAGTKPLDWPSDWPTDNVSGAFIEENGFQILKP